MLLLIYNTQTLFHLCKTHILSIARQGRHGRYSTTTYAIIAFHN
jgi:hypothetical protein